MSDIARWEHRYETSWADSQMVGSESGDYVRFEDHAAEVATLRALLAEASAIINTGHLANRSSREAHPWHERRRAWMARCEEVGRV